MSDQRKNNKMAALSRIGSFVNLLSICSQICFLMDNKINASKHCQRNSGSANHRFREKVNLSLFFPKIQFLVNGGERCHVIDVSGWKANTEEQVLELSELRIGDVTIDKSQNSDEEILEKKYVFNETKSGLISRQPLLLKTCETVKHKTIV